MLRSLLTEEQKRDLDDECRRYAAYRRSVNKEFAGESFSRLSGREFTSTVYEYKYKGKSNSLTNREEVEKSKIIDDDEDNDSPNGVEPHLQSLELNHNNLEDPHDSSGIGQGVSDRNINRNRYQGASDRNINRNRSQGASDSNVNRKRFADGQIRREKTDSEGSSSETRQDSNLNAPRPRPRPITKEGGRTAFDAGGAKSGRSPDVETSSPNKETSGSAKRHGLETPSPRNMEPSVSFDATNKPSITVSTDSNKTEKTLTFKPASIGGVGESSESSESFEGRFRRRKEKKISVDEILARGLREWREEQAKFQTSAFGRGKRYSMMARKFASKDSGQSGGTLPSHPVRDEIQRAEEEKRRRDEFERREEASVAAESTEYYSSREEYDDGVTETLESSSQMEEDEVFRKKTWHNLILATDVIKLVVYFLVFFAAISSITLSTLPEVYLPPPINIKLSERSTCYWPGGTGFLNQSNPCPYRGIMGNSETGNECLEWREAIDGGETLPGVGIDGIIFNHSLDRGPRQPLYKCKDGIREWRNMYYNVDKMNLTDKLKLFVKDYEFRFCRRFSSAPMYLVCLTLGPKGLQAKDKIYVRSCRVPPCSIMVSNRCYKSTLRYVRHKHKHKHNRREESREALREELI